MKVLKQIPALVMLALLLVIFCPFAQAAGGTLSAGADASLSHLSLSVSSDDLDAAASGVWFAVWSAENGQDDLIWHEAVSDGSGNWVCTPSLAQHSGAGTYFIHCYQRVGESRQFVASATVEVPRITGTLRAETTDDLSGAFRVTLSGVNAPDGVASARVAVWSTQNGQDDLRWYPATRSGDSFCVDVDTWNHDYCTGAYSLHCYVTDGSGASYFVSAATQTVCVDCDQTALTAQWHADGDAVDIALSRYYSTGTVAVRFAVWSQENGQDDLCWYDALRGADGNWTLPVSLAGHKSSGTYYVHCYAQTTGGMQFVRAVRFEAGVVTGNATLTTTDTGCGSFLAELTELSVPDAVQRVRFAVWSANNGQDDLIWYEAAKSANGWCAQIDTYDHNYDEGVYYIHTYLYDTRGSVRCVAGNTQTVCVDRSHQNLSAQWNPTQGTVSIALTGAYLGKDVTQARFAVWSSNNGQDDLIWYTAQRDANGAWNAQVPLTSHSGTGKYFVHCYVTSPSGCCFRAAASVQVEKTAAQAQTLVANDPAGAFRVTVSDFSLPETVAAVRVAVWSEVGGQDDLVWYTAQQQGDQWYADPNMAAHYFDEGDYIYHVYVRDRGGNFYFVAAGRQSVSVDRSGARLDSKMDANSGVLSLQLTDAYLGRTTQQVRFAVWSQADGQDDLRWYNATRTEDGNWNVDVNLGGHGYEPGAYLIHCYQQTASGSFFVKGATQTASFVNGKIQLGVASNADNRFVLQATGLKLASKNLEWVRFAVWSEENGQDDLVWYTAQQTEYGVWTVDGRMDTHNYVCGTYFVHAYAQYTGENAKCVKTGSVTLEGAFYLIWPCGSTRISSYFGYRSSPTAGASGFHQGIDIPGSTGSPIYAAASGRVTEAGYTSYRGRYVTIDHGNGISTIYMHCSALYVGVGQTVSQGQNIAAVGNTGISTGSHLHLSVLVNGVNVNPLDYVSP